MTHEEREAKLMDFLMEEAGMSVSAGGPPWRELPFQPGDDLRTLTLDLSGLPETARPRVAGLLHDFVRRAVWEECGSSDRTQ